MGRLAELERLAADPNYQLSQQELSELRRLRVQQAPVEHDTDVPRHSPDFDTHPTKPGKAGDGQPD